MTKIDSFTTEIPLTLKRTAVDTVVIHLAGDSGDGMQVAGTQLTQASATIGNDVRTFPDYPAEIRAPAGTLPGVSGFQISFSNQRIYTPGDQYDVLVAMNPAALKVAITHLKAGGLLILDEDKFTDKDFKKARFDESLLEKEYPAHYRIVRIPMSSLTLKSLEDSDLSRSAARKCKNMFALGVIYWLYHRSLQDTQDWIKERFQATPSIVAANLAALQAGYNFAITAGLFTEHFTVAPAELPAGEYRQMTGNQALAMGCVAAAMKTQQSLFVCGYPITPASDILHILAKYHFAGIHIFQAEDEIAAIGAAIGAAFGGRLAITTTSGPGMDLKSEALGLAVMAELPIVVVDVQRAGPSTGMPTKVEQSDLLMAMYGRHGECPVPILAAHSPGHCFELVMQAFRLATRYMTPVILLSDASLANGAEPWRIPEVEDLPDIQLNYCKEPESFAPYRRNQQTLARPWALPGTPGLEHRLGGLEKEDITGNISYDPQNHQAMVSLRAQKVENIADELPPLEVLGEKQGDVLIVGWGSTYGVIRCVVESLQAQQQAISAVHLTYLNPFQRELAALLKAFKYVLVVELNSGQLCQLLRAKFLVDAQSIHKVEGKPFTVQELNQKLQPFLEKVDVNG